MKKYVITSLLMLVPFVSMAADHCTNPSEYTIDKRCYVTDEQKKTKPYNAVVYLTESGCTGTIVKLAEIGIAYMLTAKHCIYDKNGLVRRTLHIKLQDGREFDVAKMGAGDYDGANDENHSGDWAAYVLDPKYKDVPSVEITDKERIGFGPFTYSYNARVVGYGTLRIMSDEQISYLKSRYIKYLKDQIGIESNGSEAVYGFYNGGIDAHDNKYVINFIHDNRPLYRNEKLKVSNCEYSSNGKSTNCQVWGGNSGGPIFDSDNKIMGIFTRLNYRIGGKNHAGSEDVWFDPSIKSIPLLK